MTDEVRQEDIDAANDALHAGISLHHNRALPTLADAFARHASPLRTRIAELEGALKACAEAPHSGWTIAQALARATLNGEKKDG